MSDIARAAVKWAEHAQAEFPDDELFVRTHTSATPDRIEVMMCVPGWSGMECAFVGGIGTDGADKELLKRACSKLLKTVTESAAYLKNYPTSKKRLDKVRPFLMHSVLLWGGDT